ncbi:MAG TPA: hypothetical protein VK524_21335, partial [Polyangiaceae bacterium]|nr:hypothetical protein [Polyangiaceae bacterium]
MARPTLVVLVMLCMACSDERLQALGRDAGTQQPDAGELDSSSEADAGPWTVRVETFARQPLVADILVTGAPLASTSCALPGD